MLNFLYCLDENYNKQCLNSIYSILNYSDIECSFYIIHKEPKSLEPINKKILNNNNLKNFVVKEFNDSVLDFVNLENVPDVCSSLACASCFSYSSKILNN